MKQITLIFTIIMSISIAHAAIITVDNKTPSVGQFKTLQEAHDAANDGDTIYVYPTEAVYSAISVAKKLKLIGTGSSRPGESLSTTSISGTILFEEGSALSVLEGFSGSFNVTFNESNITIQKNKINYITVNADDIIIKRNRIRRIAINENHKGTVILQNYVYDNSGNYLITIENNNEILISNNLLWNMYDQHNSPNWSSSSCYGKGIKADFSNITLTIIYNIISTAFSRDNHGRALNISNANIYVANNIILSGSVYKTSNNFYNNMSNSTQFPSGNGNLRNIDMSKVFVDPSNDFHLLEDSPAKGAGTDGVDMGIYGGSTPYLDDGKPSLPSIVKLKADHSASQANGLEIEIQAVSNSE